MKKRLVLIAVILAVLLILFFILRGTVNAGLGAKIDDCKAAFSLGVEDGMGGRGPSLAQALQQRLDAADGLQTIAAKHDEVYSAYTALRSARNELMTLLADGSDLSAMYAANEALDPLFKACRESLEGLTEGKERSALDTYQADMDAAQDAVSKAGAAFNAHVEDFTDSVLKRFPNSLLKGLVKTALPSYWQAP